ncbi:M4 family metallopeptidase, partial [Saprospiraceae bacterium]|nr:M4 family metallopeptidase [Saprospiraceae bacterium]
VDDMRNKHARFQHYYKGIKVEGSQLLVHSRDGYVYLVNGTLIRDLDVDYMLRLSKEEAIAKALIEVPAELYMWDSPIVENILKKMKNDPSATNYPAGDIAFVHPQYSRNSKNYRPAYDITIHSMVPEKKEQFFIDVETGEILMQLNLLHTGSSHGTAETKYHGTRSIITDSIAVDSFRLIDTIRTAGIYTLNAMGSTNVENSVHFHDHDNFWNNVNEQKDEVATDVHYSAEMTYDYYASLGQDGINGDSLPFLSLVHVNNNWNNATWNGMFARFGDGSGQNQPLASLDVVAHEFTHGLTDFTADLVYMDEPGGLNESFSDIFGTAVEFFGDPETADYLIGEDFIANGGFRSMSNPNDFNHPDTYFGDNWQNGGGDNGGVHTNSGVQNYWFYLLAEGGTGINDIAQEFNVEGLGINEAAAVALGNLKYYLMVTSQYSDARLGGIQAAADLYGECSFEVEQTTNAWHAVGVGNVFGRLDIEIIDLVGPELVTCGLSSSEFVTARLTFNECYDTLFAGTTIPMLYSVDNGDVVMEDFVLTENISYQDTFTYTFEQPLSEFNTPGEYKLTVSVAYEGDNSDHNDTYLETYDRIIAQNVDMAINSIEAPFSGCFLGAEPVVLAVSYEGCDSIVAGTLIELGYRLDEFSWVSTDYILPNSIQRGEEIVIPLNKFVQLGEIGVYDIDARVIYNGDTLISNNLIENQLIQNPDELQYQVLMTFEGPLEEVVDSFYTVNNSSATISVLDSVGFKFTKGVKFTGSDVLPLIEDGTIELPSEDNLWDINPDYKSQVCFCADLTMTDAARLKFRFTQTFSPIYEDLYGQANNASTGLRLLINGQQFENDYVPNFTEANPYFVRNLDIGEYAGGPIEICFETSTLLSAEFDPYEIGDNVHIDEVILLADAFVGTNDLEFENNLTLYPNPSTDKINLILTEEFTGYDNLKVFDIHGKLFLNNTRNTSTIDVADYPAGIYVIQIFSGDKIQTGKFIKQ